ncbi:pantoate--beta-alanine ligase [Campylobacter sp. 19-13652]|uniref:pantoate--beta-alanine ligase n=1 Tax=Campylobacter sp. 19-13652 TaxID=2840180 RepID=UPI001C78774C|nr:pantoate--beta-alanine ligase [Campylobacter sp. 19-13652]BCX79720.1 pantothenate synthetase [Campylobacter sp. 19-13652]
MQIIKTTDELIKFKSTLSGSVGFVPTMGALHAGHASLISRSVSENAHTIVSVFVNPTQFLAGEDLDKYPRSQDADAKLCESLGASAVFMPSVDEIYGKNEPTMIAPKALASKLEGAIRPGHFDGVLCVLNKLFNLVSPTRAYFGKKDAQQLLIVQNFVKASFLSLKIVPCDIVRDSSGLALSSRNAYLSDAEKAKATALSRSLKAARKAIENGEQKASVIKELIASELAPISAEYIAITDTNLNELDAIKPGDTLILLAAKVGGVRLIDNEWV